jgi:hypothetical protein
VKKINQTNNKETGMAQKTQQFQFTSGEHDVYTTMTRSETSHRFCGRTSQMDQMLGKINSANLCEAAEREARIAHMTMTMKSASAAHYRPTHLNRGGSNRMPRSRMPRIPHANRLIGVGPVHINPWNEPDIPLSGIFGNQPAMTRRPYDHFQFLGSEIDHAEDRVDERLIGGSTDCRSELRCYRHYSRRGHARPRGAPFKTRYYPRQIRLHIRVDGRVFIC